MRSVQNSSLPSSSERLSLLDFILYFTNAKKLIKDISFVLAPPPIEIGANNTKSACAD
jgi:hypothetical protein